MRGPQVTTLSQLSAIGLVGLSNLGLSACRDLATQPLAAGSGPRPSLPETVSLLLPTVNIAPAIGWPTGVAPAAAPGLQVHAFARGLEHPRYLVVLPNGDVLVPFANGQALDLPVLDVLSGFLSEQGKAYGRPVGVARDRSGALLVADDVGHVIWRASTAQLPNAATRP